MSVPVKTQQAAPPRQRVGIALVESGDGAVEIVMPPGDAREHEARLLASIATPSRAFVKAELHRLLAVSRTAPGGDPDEDNIVV